MDRVCLIVGQSHGPHTPPRGNEGAGDPQWEWGEGVNSLLPAASLCGFLQHGANEDAVDAENRSPLHWAGVCQGPGEKHGCREHRVEREGQARAER